MCAQQAAFWFSREEVQRAADAGDSTVVGTGHRGASEAAEARSSIVSATRTGSEIDSTSTAAEPAMRALPGTFTIARLLIDSWLAESDV
jgi:hypothetical protein